MEETKQLVRTDNQEAEEQTLQVQEKEQNLQENEENKEERIRYVDSGVDERIARAVKEMGFEYMTPIQAEAIPVLMEGKDVIGQAQTGTGKTAAFGIPLISRIDPELRALQAVILCPTRELAMQAAEELRRFSKYMHGVKVVPIYGGQDISRQIRALAGGVQIIVGTPGRVMDHMRRHTLKTSQVKAVVLDEADEMLNMGFREDIETILKDMPQERQTALFSATMPKPILDITHTYQKNAVFLKMTPQEVTIPLIKQAFYRIQRKDKEEVLCRLMDYYQPKRSLIFCNTKRMVDELAGHLKDRGYQAEGLHGDLSQNQRDMVMNLFRGGRTDILIATDVAARGIDVDDVEAVFNYDIPDDIEYYVHRIGRTGRAGKTGRSFTLVSGREIYKIRDIERVCHTKIKERKVPSPTQITTVKADKILAEAMQVMEKDDLSAMVEMIRSKSAEEDFDPVELAAAFMKLKMGDELKELEEERYQPENRRNGGRGGRASGPYSGRRDSRPYGDGSRGDRRSYGRKDGGQKDGRGRRYEERKSAGVPGRRGPHSDRISSFGKSAPMYIKTKTSEDKIYKTS